MVPLPARSVGDEVERRREERRASGQAMDAVSAAAADSRSR